MSLVKRSWKQKRQSENILDCMMHRTKKPSIGLEEKMKVVSRGKRWNEMPHDILVDIMKRIGYFQKTYTIKHMCKSWLSALLDSVFPPGDVLDLRLFDKITENAETTQRVYENYLWMVLKRHKYTKVFFPQRPFRRELYEGIAKRLPELECVVVHRHFRVGSLRLMTGMFRYWPKLTEAHLHVFFVRKIVHCKEITKLQLYGWIRDNNADVIANKLPQLEHLDIQSCVLSSRALAIILDGQRELKHLDTRHAARFDDKFLSVFGGNPFGKAIDWNEEEIFPKVAHIKTYLECQRKCCPVCANFYDASVSKLGLRAWLFYDLSNHPHERGWCISNKCIAGRYPYTVPTVSCIVHEFGSILPSDFRPVQDDSRVLSINRDF